MSRALSSKEMGDGHSLAWKRGFHIMIDDRYGRTVWFFSLVVFAISDRAVLTVGLVLCFNLYASRSHFYCCCWRVQVVIDWVLLEEEEI